MLLLRTSPQRNSPVHRSRHGKRNNSPGSSRAECCSLYSKRSCNL